MNWFYFTLFCTATPCAATPRCGTAFNSSVKGPTPPHFAPSRAIKGGLGRPQGGRKCGEVISRVLGFPDFLGVAKNHPKIIPETPEAIFPSSTGPNEQLFCLAQQLWSKTLAPRIFGKVAPLMLLIPLMLINVTNIT
jgi:hypothetical protein